MLSRRSFISRIAASVASINVPFLRKNIDPFREAGDLAESLKKVPFAKYEAAWIFGKNPDEMIGIGMRVFLDEHGKATARQSAGPFMGYALTDGGKNKSTQEVWIK